MLLALIGALAALLTLTPVHDRHLAQTAPGPV
jgi:hypothetical protein